MNTACHGPRALKGHISVTLVTFKGRHGTGMSVRTVCCSRVSACGIRSSAGVQCFRSCSQGWPCRQMARPAFTAEDVTPMSDPVRTWPLRLKFPLVISKSMAFIDGVGFFSAISFLC